MRPNIHAMQHNPFIWNFRGRRSVRLKGQDYSELGFYAVTICTEGRKCLFGTVRNDKILLYKQGIMVMQWWLELIYRYPQVNLNAFVIMPNHLHGILELTDPEDPDPDRSPLSRVLPEDIADAHPHRDEILNWLKDQSWVGAVATKDRVGMIKGDIASCVGAQFIAPRAKTSNLVDRRPASLQRYWDRQDDFSADRGAMNCAPTLGGIVRYFKAGSAREIQKKNPSIKVWQRSFYDSVLWTGRDIENMQDYIIQNPGNWTKDPLFAS